MVLAPEALLPPNALPAYMMADVSSAVLQAYADVGGPNFMDEPTKLSNGDPAMMVWEEGVCGAVARSTTQHLRPKYPAITEYRWGWDASDEWKMQYHAYVKIGRYTIDAAWKQFHVWQQYFDGRDPAAIQIPDEGPLVLAGTPGEVIRQAQEYGISDPRILNLWKRRHIGHAVLWAAYGLVHPSTRRYPIS